MARRREIPEGIEEQHQSFCAARGVTKRDRDELALHSKRAPKCSCTPTYRATAPGGTRGKRVRQTFPALFEAERWRTERIQLMRTHRIDDTINLTVRDAGERLLAGMQDGSIAKRGGAPYAGSVITSYESSLRAHVYPLIGGRRMDDIRRRDIQAVVDHLKSQGLTPSTINNTITPLRVIFRHAVRRGEISENPTTDLELPSNHGKRDRVANREEARRLIAVLPYPSDRAYWGIAFYGGLRLGEILALRWSDVAGDAIRVERSWCGKTRRFKNPKTASGVREVPMIPQLRELLDAHARESPDVELEALVFASSAGTPINASRVARRSERAWRAAGLPTFTPHEARHTCASIFAAAGVPLADLSRFMGHSSITITADRYRHMYPEARENAAKLVAAYVSEDSAASM